MARSESPEIGGKLCSARHVDRPRLAALSVASLITVAVACSGDDDGGSAVPARDHFGRVQSADHGGVDDDGRISRTDHHEGRRVHIGAGDHRRRHHAGDGVGR